MELPAKRASVGGSAIVLEGANSGGRSGGTIVAKKVGSMQRGGGCVMELTAGRVSARLSAIVSKRAYAARRTIGAGKVSAMESTTTTKRRRLFALLVHFNFPVHFTLELSSKSSCLHFINPVIFISLLLYFKK